jgi:hypothetical protein
MTLLQDLRVQPHPLKAFFQKSGVPVGSVARYVGRSYYYTAAVLCGRCTTSDEIEHKLHELADRLRKEVGQK